MLYFNQMTEDDAKRICEWRYTEQYKIYNLPEWNTCVQNKYGIACRETRKREFLRVCDKNGELLGFVRMRNKEYFIQIGVGLKPSVCGIGYGKQLMNKLISECYNRYENKPLRLRVRAYNKRAIKCYEKSGFTKINKESINKESDQFVIMEY